MVVCSLATAGGASSVILRRGLLQNLCYILKTRSCGLQADADGLALVVACAVVHIPFDQGSEGVQSGITWSGHLGYSERHLTKVVSKRWLGIKLYVVTLLRYNQVRNL